MTRFGYRDEALFGEGVTDPLLVAEHETRELGNVDIMLGLAMTFKDALTDAETSACRRIFEYPSQGLDATDEDWAIVRSALVRVLDGRDFCKWLCDEPASISMNYIEPYDGSENIIEESICSTYAIPDDAICLTLPSDWDDGRLWAWKADATNTDPIEERPLVSLIHPEDDPRV